MTEDIEKKDEGRFSYEPEADVLMWELSHEAAIDSAREVGNVIVHFTHQNVPVLIEILNANQFLRSTGKVLDAARGPALGPDPAGA